MLSCDAARTLVLPVSYGACTIFCNGFLVLPNFDSRDPRFIREFKAKYCIEVFAENTVTRKK